MSLQFLRPWVLPSPIFAWLYHCAYRYWNGVQNGAPTHTCVQVTTGIALQKKINNCVTTQSLFQKTGIHVSRQYWIFEIMSSAVFSRCRAQYSQRRSWQRRTQVIFFVVFNFFDYSACVLSPWAMKRGDGEACSQILSPWLGDIVDSGIGLSYRSCCLAGQYDKPMPE